MKTFEFQEILQITKMDPIQGKVWATAAIGKKLDRSNERMNYPASKPNFEAIVKSQSAASGGVNQFPMRLQHDDNFVAGRWDSVTFDDAEQRINVEGTVVHPIAKMLLAERCLTGVSIGGACTKTRLADGTVEYVAIPQEISVVDRPCLPDAVFSLVKADGTVEMCKFASEETSGSLIETLMKGLPTMSAETEKALSDKIDALEKAVNTYFELAKAAAECKCGMCEKCTKAIMDKRDVSTDERKKLADEGKAMPDGSYPIANVGDLENAIQAYGRASDPEKVKAHIIARAKALGATSKLPEKWGVTEKSDYQNPKTEVTMSKEFKDFTPEELQKAHKSAMDHLGMAKAAHAAHVAEMHKAHDAAHAEVCGHLDNCAKAMGVETVPMQSTKSATADPEKEKMEKKDTRTEEQVISDAVTAAMNKAMGIEPEKVLTLEEKVAKAVTTAIETAMQKANPNQPKPRFTSKATSSEEKELTEAELADLAKRASAGDRDAQLKMFKAGSHELATNAARA